MDESVKDTSGSLMFFAEALYLVKEACVISDHYVFKFQHVYSG